MLGGIKRLSLVPSGGWQTQPSAAGSVPCPRSIVASASRPRKRLRQVPIFTGGRGPRPGGPL
eukprot:10921956-Heterocapsa_arctica.AAC.1